jgi:hypothetical protein
MSTPLLTCQPVHALPLQLVIHAHPLPTYVLQLVLDTCTISVVHGHPPACMLEQVLNAYTITKHALLVMHALSLQLEMHAHPPHMGKTCTTVNECTISHTACSHCILTM